MSRFVDLSHTIHDGMVTYPGLPVPAIGTVVASEGGARFTAVPIKIVGLGTFPVRAFASVR